MAADKDSASWLPEPPPPRPARRDAAIDAALRKFDGEAPSPASPRKPEPWTVRHGYQLGAFATAALALVIFVPVALTGISNDRPTSDTREVPQPQARAVPHAEQSPPAQAPPSTVVLVAETPITPAPVTRSPASTADASADGSGKAQESDARQRAPAPVMVVESPNIPPTSPPALVRMNAPPPPAPPPPPPPPAAPQAVAERAEQRAATGDIVVTGTLLRAPQNKAARVRSGNDAANGRFLARLQAGIRANDRSAIAKLVALPLRVNAAGGTRTYRLRRSVERDFDHIFTPRVRRAILAQRPGEIFVRDQGAMIGDGELWFSRTCPNAACSPAGPVRITAVNP